MLLGCTAEGDWRSLNGPLFIKDIAKESRIALWSQRAVNTAGKAHRSNVRALLFFSKEHLTFAVVSAAITILLAAPVFAHHSDAIYDKDNLVTVTGTVAQFDFMNPHEVIYLDVKGDHGKPDQWIVFGSAPVVLARVGWNKNTIKSGEKISIIGFQFKDGRKGMLQLKVVQSNGKLLPIGEVERNYLKSFASRQAELRKDLVGKK